MTEPTKKPRPARRRARKSDGKFKGDNPATPDVNEAWEPTELESALPKKKDYSIKQKIKGPSSANAGKYGHKPKTRPTFGNVTRTDA